MASKVFADVAVGSPGDVEQTGRPELRTIAQHGLMGTLAGWTHEFTGKYAGKEAGSAIGKYLSRHHANILADTFSVGPEMHKILSTRFFAFLKASLEEANGGGRSRKMSEEEKEEKISVTHWLAALKATEQYYVTHPEELAPVNCCGLPNAIISKQVDEWNAVAADVQAREAAAEEAGAGDPAEPPPADEEMAEEEKDGPDLYFAYSLPRMLQGDSPIYKAKGSERLAACFEAAVHFVFQLCGEEPCVFKMIRELDSKQRQPVHITARFAIRKARQLISNAEHYGWEFQVQDDWTALRDSHIANERRIGEAARRSSRPALGNSSGRGGAAAKVEPGLKQEPGSADEQRRGEQLANGSLQLADGSLSREEQIQTNVIILANGQLDALRVQNEIQKAYRQPPLGSGDRAAGTAQDRRPPPPGEWQVAGWKLPPGSGDKGPQGPREAGGKLPPGSGDKGPQGPPEADWKLPPGSGGIGPRGQPPSSDDDSDQGPPADRRGAFRGRQLQRGNGNGGQPAPAPAPAPRIRTASSEEESEEDRRRNPIRTQKQIECDAKNRGMRKRARKAREERAATEQRNGRLASIRREAEQGKPFEQRFIEAGTPKEQGRLVRYEEKRLGSERLSTEGLEEWTQQGRGYPLVGNGGTPGERSRGGSSPYATSCPESNPGLFRSSNAGGGNRFAPLAGNGRGGHRIVTLPPTRDRGGSYRGKGQCPPPPLPLGQEGQRRRPSSQAVKLNKGVSQQAKVQLQTQMLEDFDADTEERKEAGQEPRPASKWGKAAPPKAWKTAGADDMRTRLAEYEADEKREGEQLTWEEDLGAADSPGRRSPSEERNPRFCGRWHRRDDSDSDRSDEKRRKDDDNGSGKQGERS